MRDSGKKEFQERVSPENRLTAVFQSHYANYYFAHKFIPHKIVLDIGCGTGYGSNYLAQDGKRVIGVDISDEAIEYARSHYKALSLNFTVMDAERLGFPDGVFDVACSFEVIEHLDDYKMHLSEIFRVLKPGGLFLLSTPNKRISLLTSPFGPNPHHKKEFELSEIKELLSGYCHQIEIFGKTLDCRIERSMAQSPLKKILSKIDFLGLRRKLPVSVRSKMAKWSKVVIEEAVSFKDFIITKENLEDAENFLVVCKKGA